LTNLLKCLKKPCGRNATQAAPNARLKHQAKTSVKKEAMITANTEKDQLEKDQPGDAVNEVKEAAAAEELRAMVNAANAEKEANAAQSEAIEISKISAAANEVKEVTEVGEMRGTVNAANTEREALKASAEEIAAIENPGVNMEVIAVTEAAAQSVRAAKELLLKRKIKMKAKIISLAFVFILFINGTGFAGGIAEDRAQREYNSLSDQADACFETGDFDSAVLLLKRMHELKPDEILPVEYLGIAYLGIPDDRPELNNAMHWLLEADKRFSVNEIAYYNLACVYSVRGDLDNAVKYMNKAVLFGFTNFIWMSQDDDLDNFKNTQWWRGIARTFRQIENTLDSFYKIVLGEEELDFDDKITFYKNVIENFNRLAPGIPALRSVPLFSLGSLYNSINDYNSAIRYCAEAADIKEKILGDEHPEYALILNILGGLYKDAGDYVKSEQCFLKSLSIREKTSGKNHTDYAQSLNNLGSLYDFLGDYNKSEQYFTEALGIYEKISGKNHQDYASALNNLGCLYNNMGDYLKAEQYYLEASETWKKIHGPNHLHYALSLNNLGALYEDMSDYEKAERYYFEALDIMEKSHGRNHPDYAVSLNNLGMLYFRMNDFVKAERYFLEAADIHEKFLGNEHPDYAVSLNNLGVLYNNTGDYEKSIQYSLRALYIYEKTLGKEHPDYANSLNNLGALYFSVGGYERAEQYYFEALGITEKTQGKEHPSYATLLNNIGSLYDKTGDYAKAEKYYLESISIKEKTLGKNHPDYVTSLNNLYVIYLAVNDYGKAIACKQEANQRNTDQINRYFSFMSEQQRNYYWNANADAFEICYSLSFHHPVSESNILNYDNALFSKGLLLRTTNAVRDSIYASGNQNLINQFEELGGLRQQISILSQSGGSEAYVRSLEEKAEVLDRSLTQSSSAFSDFQKDLKLNWKNIRDNLQPDEAAVEFVSFDVYDKGWTNRTRYAALVLRPGMESPVWVPLCEENVLTSFFKPLEGMHPDDMAEVLYNDNGIALYEEIWRPLEKELDGAGTIFYSPSGLLYKVSFNAIPVPSDSQKRLMDVYNLNLVSSTREVVNSKTRNEKTPDSAVVYGGLDYDTDAENILNEALVYAGSGAAQTRGIGKADTSDYLKNTGRKIWTYLPFTGIESKEIQQILEIKRIPVTLYSEAKGNKESFLALNGRKINIIHLATHGFFNRNIQKNLDDRGSRTGEQPRIESENPLRRSGLILSGANTLAENAVEGAQNGVLLAEEVAMLNLLGAEIVVLSACETALGEVDNSEGVFGLQRAFKLAGAQTLIMSLWEVDDTATSILMSAFYENWLSGMSKQEAFREAQQKLRSDLRFNSPFFWAAFVVMD